MDSRYRFPREEVRRDPWPYVHRLCESFGERCHEDVPRKWHCTVLEVFVVFSFSWIFFSLQLEIRVCPFLTRLAASTFPRQDEWRQRMRAYVPVMKRGIDDWVWPGEYFWRKAFHGSEAGPQTKASQQRMSYLLVSSPMSLTSVFLLPSLCSTSSGIQSVKFQNATLLFRLQLKYKLVSLCYNCLSSTAPGLKVYKPTRQLRASSDTRLWSEIFLWCCTVCLERSSLQKLDHQTHSQFSNRL